MYYGEKKYLEYVRKNPRQYPGPNEPFEDNFEFNSLHYSVYRRFIELLYPATNHFFRKASKKNYQQCLDLRGIEVEELNFGVCTGYHGGLWFRNGNIALNLDRVPTNWAKCLVVTGDVYISYPRHGSVPDIEKLDFIKKNTSMYIAHGFPEQLECLIHPGLEKVCINDDYLEFHKLLRCLKKLNVCQHLESIGITNCKVKSAATFKQLKEQLEHLAGRHPHAEIDCQLDYENEFQIHENVLCHYLQPGVLPGVFVKDYNIENLLQY